MAVVMGSIPEKLHAHFADQRQALVDAFGAQVGQIEVDVIEAVGSREAASLEDFRHLRAGNDVARRKLHHFGRVLLHEALALVVAQVTAFAAAAFGHQYSRGHEPGGMKLEELRVLQCQPGAVGNGLAVAGYGLRIGRETVKVSQPAGGNQERLAPQDVKLARGQIVEREPGEPPAFEKQGSHEAFVVALEILVLEERVVERLHLEEARLVSRHAGPSKGMAAERPLHDSSILAARPGASPVFKQADFVRRAFHEAVHHVLVGEEIRTLYGVPGVQLQAVALFGAHHCGRAAFRAHRMRAHDLYF